MKQILLSRLSFRKRTGESFSITVSRSGGMDFTDESSIRSIIRESQADLIVNPAAYTKVNVAETEKELAFAINVNAPQIIEEEAKALNIP